VAAISQNSFQPVSQYAEERKEFCTNFLQPTTTTNHKTVDNPDYESRSARLNQLITETNNPEIVRRVIARASMLSELVK
jgi:hypothetical protein